MKQNLHNNIDVLLKEYVEHILQHKITKKMGDNAIY